MVIRNQQSVREGEKKQGRFMCRHLSLEAAKCFSPSFGFRYVSRRRFSGPPTARSLPLALDLFLRGLSFLLQVRCKLTPDPDRRRITRRKRGSPCRPSVSASRLYATRNYKTMYKSVEIHFSLQQVREGSCIILKVCETLHEITRTVGWNNLSLLDIP